MPDPRYRHQPIPVGTRVVMLPFRGQTSEDYAEMCERNGGGNPATATVIAIDGAIFKNSCPVRIMRGHAELIANFPPAETVQWPLAALIPFDDLAPVDAGREALEEWLGS